MLKTVAGTLTPVGTLAKFTARLLAGLIAAAGSIILRPIYPSADVTVSEFAVTELSIDDAALTSLSITDAVLTRVTLRAVTV